MICGEGKLENTHIVKASTGKAGETFQIMYSDCLDPGLKISNYPTNQLLTYDALDASQPSRQQRVEAISIIFHQNPGIWVNNLFSKSRSAPPNSDPPKSGVDHFADSALKGPLAYYTPQA